MSQLHIHSARPNTAPRPELPEERAGDDTICSTKCNFPQICGKKSFLTTCNELLQPRLEAELTKLNQLFQLLFKSCPIKALVMLKYFLFAPQIWRLLNLSGDLRHWNDAVPPWWGCSSHVWRKNKELVSPSASILVKWVPNEESSLLVTEPGKAQLEFQIPRWRQQSWQPEKSSFSLEFGHAGCRAIEWQ